MKRLLLTLMLTLAVGVRAAAMSYEEAREQAWFLTDKMAYELNLTSDQYDRVYEINFDFFYNLRTASDCSGVYWTYRNTDLQYVLFDWQYTLYLTTEYFYRPVRWVRSAWYFSICTHYRKGVYYFDRPTVYISYYGQSWKRRGHNDPSPYRNFRSSSRRGMRDSYDRSSSKGTHHSSNTRTNRNERTSGHSNTQTSGSSNSGKQPDARTGRNARAGSTTSGNFGRSESTSNTNRTGRSGSSSRGSSTSRTATRSSRGVSTRTQTTSPTRTTTPTKSVTSPAQRSTGTGNLQRNTGTTRSSRSVSTGQSNRSSSSSSSSRSQRGSR